MRDYDRAEKYLIALGQLENAPWFSLYDQQKAGKLSIEQQFVLCHPRYYFEEMDQASSAARGKRQFDPDLARSSYQCDAMRVWGYACVVNANGSRIVADHFFPYAFGGPTESSNRLYLCALHNRLKGCDIHNYDWPDSPPIWMESLLVRIERLLKFGEH